MHEAQLSRMVSHALRHEPWLYELELDHEGWASVEALLNALHGQGARWVQLTRDDLAALIDALATGGAGQGAGAGKPPVDYGHCDPSSQGPSSADLFVQRTSAFSV